MGLSAGLAAVPAVVLAAGLATGLTAGVATCVAAGVTCCRGCYHGACRGTNHGNCRETCRRTCRGTCHDMSWVAATCRGMSWYEGTTRVLPRHSMALPTTCRGLSLQFPRHATEKSNNVRPSKCVRGGVRSHNNSSRAAPLNCVLPVQTTLLREQVPH